MRTRLYIKGFIVTGLSLVLGVGCQVERPIPENELPSYTKKLVVNSAIDNINPISLTVSNTASAYSDDVPMEYTDVNIELRSTTSSITIPLTYDNVENKFVATRAADPGKTYEVIISDTLGSLETIRAFSTMPDKVLSKEIGYIENGGTDIDGRQSDLLSIKWIDVAGKHYYMLHFYYYSATADLFIPFDFETTDPTLLAPETVKLNDGGFLFNDDLFNGREKMISAVPPGGLVANNPDVLYLIELRTVSQDYYRYYTTLQQYRDQQDLQQAGPFGSAVIVHSNVKNGLGAFVCSTLESDTIR